ncbi:MAG: hypothetical protein IPK16_16685 [Anaerolineales bacterium]|nr:hypothetical protein [Anaerolineales bacterium]
MNPISGKPIGFETYRETQNPAPLSFPIRLELNGHFFSVANFVEDANGDFLARNQLDLAGAHFKMYENALTLGGFSDPATGARQRRPDWIDRRPALRKLILGLNQHLFDPVDGRAKTAAYVFDHVNVPG